MTTVVLNADMHKEPGSLLTPRQTQIVALVARHMKNREVAQQLGLTPTTVRNHLQNIFRVLRVRDRHEMVQRAIREGIIPPNSDTGEPQS